MRVPTILPYPLIVGQDELKLALELCYVAPRIGGVLLSGQRGTGKSTAVRAFAQMVYGGLPVTLPINATEDRVVGGWKIEDLMHSSPVPQEGLLEQARGKILYVDEVNLLDDHIVNLILDVCSTGVLVTQRQGLDKQDVAVSFILVGTMNPEEGFLRPQLLDRFGLMVPVKAEVDASVRERLLATVLAFDEAQSGAGAGFASRLERAEQDEIGCRARLDAARAALREGRVQVPDAAITACVRLATTFAVEGHRAECVMALAARACAALHGETSVSMERIESVAPLALCHRRPDVLERGRALWDDTEDGQSVRAILDEVAKGQES